MYKSITILVCLLLTFAKVFSQNAKTLTVDDFIAKVKAHHPLARVANIQIDKANATVLIAKGGFDPVAEFNASSKTFDSKNYYYYNNAAVKIPLPIGDVKTGIENNGGQFLESEITSGRSSYLGVEIPLAKGLLIDKRRAFLQQAKIAVQENSAVQKSLLNDLLLEAYISYYQWAAAYKLYNVFNNYVLLSTNRLSLVKTTVVNGDRPAMDSVEAITQLQNFELLKSDALLKLNGTVFNINNFIWDEKGIAQSIALDIIPDTTMFANNNFSKKIDILLQNGNTQNPLLQQYKFKIEGLQIDKKLKYQNFLPSINLKANLLNNNYFVAKNFGSSLLENNNRWGIDIKIPLRFREARGEYKMAKLKIEETSLALKQKALEIENKINDYTTQFFLLQKQLIITIDAYNNYNSLLRNETLRFANGESSLFLVNTRESKLLEMEQKIIDLNFKLVKAKYSLDWAAGVLQ